MLKLIGGLMIVFASGWTGLAPAARLRRQLALLEQLDGALSLMRAELTSSLTPLPDLFKKLALSLDGAAAQLFDRLSRDMLSQPLSTPLHLMRKNLPPLRLEPRENAILLELANALGCYDLQSQQRMLDSAQARLRQAEERCRRQLDAQARSWAALGICTGLALAIVLV